MNDKKIRGCLKLIRQKGVHQLCDRNLIKAQRSKRCDNKTDGENSPRVNNIKKLITLHFKVEQKLLLLKNNF